MDVGNGLHIADKFFSPIGEPVGFSDQLGTPLCLGDRVSVRGCKATIGFIGKSIQGNPAVFFAIQTTIAWYLNLNIAGRLTKLI